MEKRFIYKITQDKNIVEINEIGADGWELAAIDADNLYWKREQRYPEEYRTRNEEYVLEVFRMFRRIYRSAEELGLDLSDSKVVPHYLGFDGNHETSFFAIAEGIIKEEGSFLELAKIGFSDSNNSHCLMAQTYSKMLRYLSSIPETYITEDQLKSLVNL